MEVKAFPGTPTFDQDANRTVWQEGMDLRDYFAAKAMQSHIGLAGSSMAKELEEINPDSFMIDHIATVAYKMADAMMEARNGNTK